MKAIQPKAKILLPMRNQTPKRKKKRGRKRSQPRKKPKRKEPKARPRRRRPTYDLRVEKPQ